MRSNLSGSKNVIDRAKGELVRAGIVLLGILLGTSWAQSPFGEMEPFTLVGYEVLADPTNALSDFAETSIDEIEPDGVGYRFYFSQGSAPSVLYQDVCPAGYETTWYTFNSEDNAPISFGFYAEVRLEGGDYSGWFSPIFMDDYRRRAGNPIFMPPVHVAFCGYSPTRGAYRSTHTTFVENVSTNLSAEVSCRIMVNNSGNQRVLDIQRGRGGAVYCMEPQ